MTIHCEKIDLRPLYFAQKCPQNAGNRISETHITNILLGCMSPDPPRIVPLRLQVAPRKFFFALWPRLPTWRVSFVFISIKVLLHFLERYECQYQSAQRWSISFKSSSKDIFRWQPIQK